MIGPVRRPREDDEPPLVPPGPGALRRLREAVADPRVARCLIPEEQRVVVVRHHWLAYVLPVVEMVAAVVAGTWWYVASDVDAAGVPFVLTLVVFGHGLYRAAREHLDRFVVTTTRVFRISGVFSQQVASMPIARVLDITVRRPLPGRLLRYGHLVLESAAQEQGLREITMVPRPERLDQIIHSTRIQAERRSRRRGRRRPDHPAVRERPSARHR